MAACQRTSLCLRPPTKHPRQRAAAVGAAYALPLQTPACVNNLQTALVVAALRSCLQLSAELGHLRCKVGTWYWCSFMAWLADVLPAQQAHLLGMRYIKARRLRARLDFGVHRAQQWCQPFMASESLVWRLVKLVLQHLLRGTACFRDGHCVCDGDRRVKENS